MHLEYPLSDLLPTLRTSLAQGVHLPPSFPLVFPFPPNHRNKIKPQIFRPKTIQKNVLELFQGSRLVSSKNILDIKSRFFKRPSPSPVNHLSEHKKKELGETTAKPLAKVEIFFGTPEPVTTVATVTEDPSTLNP